MIKDVKALQIGSRRLNAPCLDKVIEHGMHGHLKGEEQILAIEVIEAEIKGVVAHDCHGKLTMKMYVLVVSKIPKRPRNKRYFSRAAGKTGKKLLKDLTDWAKRNKDENNKRFKGFTLKHNCFILKQ